MSLVLSNVVEKFTQQPVSEVHEDLLFVLKTTNTGYHVIHLLKWLNRDPVDPDTQAPIQVEDYEACCAMVQRYVAICLIADIEVPKDVEVAVERAESRIAQERKRVAANKNFDQIVLGQPMVTAVAPVTTEQQHLEVPFVAMEFKFARNPYYSHNLETCIAVTLSPDHTLNEICAKLAAIRDEFQNDITENNDDDCEDDDDDEDYVCSEDNETTDVGGGGAFGGHTSQLIADLDYILNNDSSTDDDEDDEDDDDDDEIEVEFQLEAPDYIMEHSQSLSPQTSGEDDSSSVNESE